MPIAGLTDRETVDKRYPEVGRLNKGDVKPEQGPGRELPYFRFAGATEKAKDAWEAAIMSEPRRLRAYLPYPTVDENWSTWIEAWNPGNGRMMWRSNKRQTTRIWLEDRGTHSDKKEDQVSHADALKISNCSEWAKGVGRLSLVFPELLEAGCVGVVTLITHGIYDLARISGALYRLESDCQNRGHGIAGVEVALERREVERPDPSGKKWKHYDVFLFPAESYVVAQLEGMRQEMVAQLPPGTTVIDSETGEVLDESPRKEATREPKTETLPAEDNPVPQAGTQAAIRKATIAPNAGQAWNKAATELVARWPHYGKDGKPDWYHLVGAAGKLGYAEITLENLEVVIKALEAYAARKTSAAIPETAISRDEGLGLFDPEPPF